MINKSTLLRRFALGAVVAATTAILPQASGASLDQSQSVNRPERIERQVSDPAPFQIHHNISGEAINRGEYRSMDWVTDQINQMQDPGPHTDPPETIFLNEACENMVIQLRDALERDFGIAYTLVFHNHFVDEPDGTFPGVCNGDDNNPVDESAFGVAVLQRGPNAQLQVERFDTQRSDDGEVRGYACAIGGTAQKVMCSAHMNFESGEPDPVTGEITPAEQFQEYWSQIQTLVSRHDLPIVWSGDVYRSPTEIADENPGFYTLNTEADSDGCTGPGPFDRPTATNGVDRKVDHIFVTNADPPSCDQAYVTPITELCDYTGTAAIEAAVTTTSTTVPPGGSCELTGDAGKFDHSLIRGHFDVPTVDDSAPVTTAATDPPANAAGWHRSSVTVSFNAVDDGAVQSITYEATGAQPIPSTTVPGDSASVLIEAEGITTIRYFATDQDGNIETTKVLTVRIDITAPSVTGTADRPPDHNGWYNSPFTVTWSGSDSLSGIASCDPPADYDGPDTNIGIFIGFCTDVAGNTGTGNVTYHYDATPPAVTASADRGPDFNNWYNEPLTITFDGSDETSGIDTCDAPVTYDGPDGEDLSVTGGCVDVAGNSATDTFGPFRYDNTPPTATIDGSSTQLILNALDPSMSGTASDNLAGVWLIGVEFQNQVTSQTVTRLAECPSSCFVLNTPWTVDTSGLAGTYRVRVRAADLAGNAGSWSAPVTAIIL